MTELPADRGSFSKLVEAQAAQGSLDIKGIKSLIERLKGSDLATKRELLMGTISTVEPILANPDLGDAERQQVQGVMDALQAELKSIADTETGGAVPPNVDVPGAQ